MFTTLAVAALIAAQMPQPALVWRESLTDPSGAFLLIRPRWCHGTYCDPEKIVGGYNPTIPEYRPLVDGKWQAPTDIPPDAPALPAKALRKPTKPQPQPTPEPKSHPTGVRNDLLHVTPGPPRLNGIPLTEEEFEATLTDDSSLPFLTVIAPKSEWRTILDAIPANVKTGTRLKCLEPTAWQVKKFKVAQTPCVIYQKPDGTVVTRSEPFDAERFLAALAPRQPDTPEPPLAPPAPTDSSNSYLWLLGGIAAVILFLRNR